MALYNKRLQILLTDEQFDFIKNLAVEKEQSVGEIIRYAVDITFRPRQSIKEIQAWNQLMKMELISSQQISELKN